MSLTERIEQATTDAMKARDQERLDTLRMLRSGFKNEQIALGHELSDDEALKVLQRQAKQRQDSIDQYRGAGREEAAAKEEREKAIITEFLPTQMSDDELSQIVTNAISSTGTASAAEMGKVIGAVRAQVGNAADGSRIAALVKEHLQG